MARSCSSRRQSTSSLTSRRAATRTSSSSPARRRERIQRGDAALARRRHTHHLLTRGEGALRVADRFADGASSTTTLRSGDVVPLVPRTLDDQPLTPDKAVTLDLANGDYPVWIYPHRNEAYVGEAPWRERRHRLEIPREIVRRYRLVETEDGRFAPPIESSGGTWSFPVDDRATRTVSWNAGSDSVTVTDRDVEGNLLQGETLSIGRRVNAG